MKFVELWFIGVFLLAFCVFVHVFGLITLSRIYFHEAVHRHRRRSIIIATTTFSIAAFAAACLHTIQALIWSGVYLHVGAAPDFYTAVCFSIGAFTTYASSGYIMARDFILLSEIQAMNGVMAFGLTTAFLFSLALRLHRNES
jgi:MFS family permease